MAQILSIVYQPQEERYEDGRFDYFIRIPIQQANLIAQRGIEGDRKAGRNPKRQLNLLSDDWLAARQQEGYKTAPGDFGEQLIISGLSVLDLNSGTILQLGDEAQIEITRPRTGCSRLAAAQDLDGDWPGGPIGVLARVTRSGTIRVGDPVTVLEEESVDPLAIKKLVG
jgi:MOSC domain-containing protein YiiM